MSINRSIFSYYLTKIKMFLVHSNKRIMDKKEQYLDIVINRCKKKVGFWSPAMEKVEKMIEVYKALDRLNLLMP